MVTTGALLHGDVARHLDFSAEEHPLALQLGGSEPSELAQCARLAQRWGYDEVNLNCGCPSPRVQRGSFGACLMAEPALVRDCVAAMRDAVSLPVTVKHRIGIDRIESYGFVRDFVGTVGEGGCSVFIVHARNAWLDGLSPKRNREVPPLRHDTVVQLKADFPQWTFVVNGGLHERPQIEHELARVDGVMLGRVAYHDPWRLIEWQGLAFGVERPPLPDPRQRRGRDGALHGATRDARRHAVDGDRASHDGSAPWRARRAPLAPGVVGSSTAHAAGPRSDADARQAMDTDPQAQAAIESAIAT